MKLPAAVGVGGTRPVSRAEVRSLPASRVGANGLPVPAVQQTGRHSRQVATYRRAGKGGAVEQVFEHVSTARHPGGSGWVKASDGRSWSRPFTPSGAGGGGGGAGLGQCPRAAATSGRRPVNGRQRFTRWRTKPSVAYPRLVPQHPPGRRCTRLSVWGRLRQPAARRSGRHVRASTGHLRRSATGPRVRRSQTALRRCSVAGLVAIRPLPVEGASSAVGRPLAVVASLVVGWVVARRGLGVAGPGAADSPLLVVPRLVVWFRDQVVAGWSGRGSTANCCRGLSG